MVFASRTRTDIVMFRKHLSAPKHVDDLEAS